MKKAALLIAILSLVVATLAADQMRVLDSYAARLEPSLADSIQKPKGDELTEEFHQLYPLSPTGRFSIANVSRLSVAPPVKTQPYAPPSRSTPGRSPACVRSTH